MYKFLAKKDVTNCGVWCIALTCTLVGVGDYAAASIVLLIGSVIDWKYFDKD